ncbi:sensor histidine kinase [Actinoplanes couchii]|uniref:histidine kinase n=1 Tax=Actinoplanes couchii TaxID=403638 RepID=A0ABQ3XMB2_9ACTN|nr:histidine kinase [Actinoplanes couchii]MDR6321532.1 signal transduction histidine kinase [Actinoplanes couchii]GID59628.1 histidine kinase [Actinoplanes couchii]
MTVRYLLGSLLSAVVTLAGLPLWPVPRLARFWAARHRSRATRVLAGSGSPPRQADAGADGDGDGERTARAVLWLPVHVVTGLVLGLPALLCVGNIVVASIATPLWWAFPLADRPRLFVDIPVPDWTTALTLGPLQIVLLLAVARWVLPPLARLHARICVAVLSYRTNEQLADRVAVLTRTRAEVLDAHGAELRRIERDLHDGTQARLVAIAMRLAVARDAFTDVPRDDAFVEGLIREAHEGVEEAMAELRTVIRSVYPPILADRGLDGALTAVTAGCAVPVKLELGDLERVPAAVAAVAYFTVAEALTNVSKHSGATGAGVRAGRTADRLSLVICDNGHGGADDRQGTGLAGIRRRVSALDGTATVDSPAGGPTTVTVELPCGW